MFDFICDINIVYNINNKSIVKPFNTRDCGRYYLIAVVNLHYM